MAHRIHLYMINTASTQLVVRETSDAQLVYPSGCQLVHMSGSMNHLLRMNFGFLQSFFWLVRKLVRQEDGLYDLIELV